MSVSKQQIRNCCHNGYQGSGIDTCRRVPASLEHLALLHTAHLAGLRFSAAAEVLSPSLCPAPCPSVSIPLPDHPSHQLQPSVQLVCCPPLPVPPHCLFSIELSSPRRDVLRRPPRSSHACAEPPHSGLPSASHNPVVQPEARMRRAAILLIVTTS